MYCTKLVFFEGYGDHRHLHVLTHSSPTRRCSDLGTGIVTEARPGGHDIALVGRRQRFDRGPAAGERLEIGPGMRHGRLLEHDLGEPDAVRIRPLAGPPAPGKDPRLRIIPVAKLNRSIEGHAPPLP